ncbi:hypothetical protein [Ruegeria sp. ANG-R]|uniref:hypothetical protein n=1 Tax=Ruegeria sp. ANG-R TaxID=1577903 RepID=UPI001269FD75|nr:hypothetical protein [Ruegeria sp. ANG-R]
MGTHLASKLLYIVCYCFLLPKFACAEEHQKSLAGEIEETSMTEVTFGESEPGVDGFQLSLTVKRSIKVKDCQIIAWTEETDPWRTKRSGIKFNLSRTLLPDLTDEGNPKFGIMDLGEHSSIGVITFSFAPLYQPTSLPQADQNKVIEQYIFRMEKMTDSRQHHRLLTALQRYKDNYCVFSS